MSQILEKTKTKSHKFFLVTYDKGEKGTQKMKVPHLLFETSQEFRKCIITMKCSSCNFASNFESVKKEPKL